MIKSQVYKINFLWANKRRSGSEVEKFDFAHPEMCIVLKIEKVME